MCIEFHKNFIDNQLCIELTEKVFNLRQYWKKSNHKSEINSTGLKVSQLGVSAASVDASIGGGKNVIENFDSEKLHSDALLSKISIDREEEIGILKSTFGDLDTILQTKFTNLLNKTARFLPNGTFYRFNIHTDFVGCDSGRGWHFDDQVRIYSRLLLEGNIIQEQYSFTIIISVPEYSSFDYYNEHTTYITNPWQNKGYDIPCKPHSGLKGDECMNPNCPYDKSTINTIDFELGALLIQKGRYFHRPGKSIFNKNESRITIQLFATEVDDVIWIYN